MSKNDPFLIDEEEQLESSSEQKKTIRERVRAVLFRPVFKPRSGSGNESEGGDSHIHESRICANDICPACGERRGDRMFCPVTELEHTADAENDDGMGHSPLGYGLTHMLDGSMNPQREQMGDPFADVTTPLHYDPSNPSHTGFNSPEVSGEGTQHNDPFFNEENESTEAVHPSAVAGERETTSLRTIRGSSVENGSTTSTPQAKKGRGVLGFLPFFRKKSFIQTDEHKELELDEKALRKQEEIERKQITKEQSNIFHEIREAFKARPKAKVDVKSLRKQEEKERKQLLKDQSAVFHEIRDDFKVEAKKIKKKKTKE